MATKYDIASDLLRLSEQMTESDLEKAAKEIVECYGPETKSILKALQTKQEFQKNTVTVTSARELSRDQQAEIATASNQEIADISFRIDKSLLGGIVIKKGDRIIDNSLSSKLSELQNIFIKNARGAKDAK